MEIKLWVFPEGTRRNNGKIHPFKKGAFHMAISKKIPIIPLVYSRYYFLDDNARRFDCGNIIITALPQIETKDYTMDNLEELMEEVRSVMIKTFNETSKEVVSDTISNSNVDVN
nr:1-acyl-sn-glycerol-3-phosphate acyltransferase alpha-like isoform X2 [Leptinotarsa decemlineata]